MANELDYLSLHAPELMLDLLVAVAAGFLLGFERQRRNKPGGVMMAILVTVGSMIFVFTGGLIAAEAPLENTDVTRIGSMIITGIGFIGGGAIMRSERNVTGLTSAALIWSLGGLGILIGTGHRLTALMFAVALFVLLRMVPHLEHYLFNRRFCTHFTISMLPEHSDAVRSFLLEESVGFTMAEPDADGGLIRMKIDECGIEARPDITPILQSMEGVESVVDHGAG